jgi:hypothetical protein
MAWQLQIARHDHFNRPVEASAPKPSIPMIGFY